MGQRSCMNGFAAGKNASLSCERSGLRFAHTVGLPALHRSGHLHMVGNKLPSTANRQFASLNATQVWCAPTATNHGNFPLAHFVHSPKNSSVTFASMSPPVSLAYPGSLLAVRSLRDYYSGKEFPRTLTACFPYSNLSNYFNKAECCNSTPLLVLINMLFSAGHFQEYLPLQCHRQEHGFSLQCQHIHALHV